MKLNELLKEDHNENLQKIVEWLKPYNIFVDWSEITATKFIHDHIDVDNMKLHNKSIDLMLQATGQHDFPFEWPLDRNVNEMNFTLFSMAGTCAIIKDFTDFPRVYGLTLTGAQVKSLNGFDKLGIESLTLRSKYTEIEGGLLRILKAKLMTFNGEDLEDDLEKACKIVKHYIQDENSDVIGCQSALIDADLEKYAKL